MTRFLRMRQSVYLGVFIVQAAGAIAADDLAVKGFNIAARADTSDDGFASSAVDLTMDISDRSGRQSKRLLVLRTLERNNNQEGDKSLIVFSKPADISRTALLSHARLIEDDLQWLFLPSIGRVKRISSANKSGPFVGSEFSFEDLTGQELHKYQYRWLATQTESNLVCDVVERRPRYERSGYAKQHVWFDLADGQIRKIEFFDGAGTRIKTLLITDYRKYKDRYFRAHAMDMQNHLTGKRTTLTFGEFRFGVDYSVRDFDKAALAQL